jgi:hypothetical protein
MQSTIQYLSDAELDAVTGGTVSAGNGNGFGNSGNGSGNGSNNNNLSIEIRDNLLIGGSVSTGNAIFGHSGSIFIANNA